MALTPDKIEEVLTRIESGESQADIARSLHISVGSLSNYLAAPDIAERSARARSNSAEAWLDKGLSVINAALMRDAGYDSTAVRAYAQECARRAAIRNPAYRDKVDMTGTVSHAVTLKVDQADEAL